MTMLRIGILSLFLISGWFDAVFLRRKDLACATWGIGVAGLTAWVAYPLTPIRIAAAAMIAVLAFVTLRTYYKLPRRTN